MPDRLTAAVAVTTVALAAAAFGGAYALAHGDPAAPADPRPPESVTLAEDPLPELSRARPLPDLAAPPAPPEPSVEPDTEPESIEPTAPIAPVTPAPAPAPAPTPAPTPAPEPEPAPPSNFDDSG